MTAKASLPRASALLLAIAVLLLLLGRLTLHHRTAAPSRVAPSVSVATPRSTRAERAAVTAGAPIAATPAATPLSRAEIVAYLKAVYRKEQLSREIDLEQQRYGHFYWQADNNGPTLARIAAQRQALLRQLSAEANAILASEVPGETGEPIELTAIFDADHPAPNVSFLTPESRRAFESAVLASGETSADRLTELAAQTITTAELQTYRQWNDRDIAALRDQLVGFGPTEAEFLAILNRNRAGADAADEALSDLQGQLGPERYAELQRLENPGMQTAVHDLDRLGLPLNLADWLSQTRQSASAAVQQIWQDNTLSPQLKADRVASLEKSYGQAIAAKLGLRTASLDELGPLQ